MRIALAGATTLVAAQVLVASQTAATPPRPPRFDVVSIKPAESDSFGFQWTPGRFTGPAIPLTGLLNMAWGVPLKLEGGPPWLRSSMWNITATWDAARVVTVEERAPIAARAADAGAGRPDAARRRRSHRPDWTWC